MVNENSIDRHRQAFQEEAREILVELESSLLELNERSTDSELIGRVFRLMHTIKGSGAMFGFDDVAAFTHHLESAYDEIRNGRLSVSPELVDISLEALDRIKAMLGNADEAAKDQPRAEAVMAKLQALVGGSAPAAPKSAAAKPVAVEEKAPPCEWLIRFTPRPDLLRNGSDPLLLMRELRQMGDLKVTAKLADLPPLSELDPERCYVSWVMTLSTSASREAIRDVFIFVEDCCDLVIEPAIVQSQQVAKALEDPRKSAGRRDYDKADNASSIRVPAAKLDQYVNLVGELVTVQARLSEIATRSGNLDIASVTEEVERLTAALRDNSMSIRMLPIRGTFERFRRLVHDLARDLHKNVELTIEGAETELDKTVIDQLADPLMHLIRNSMDHGIEPPEVRAADGKPMMAKIHLCARHCGASVLISVTDDGRGIDPDAVREKAVRNGLIPPDAQPTESEIYSFILMPGFSTAREVTDVSGRGVGMDVVKQKVEALRGNIEIVSQRGAGTTITLRLPLTLAIIDGLLVRVDQAYYVLPLANTLECIELTQQDIENANGKHVTCVRGEIVPYIRLRDFFEFESERPIREQIMISDTDDGRYGFVVDEVLGDHQTVIKNLGRLFRNVPFVSGATILGDGTVALILDPHRLVQEAVRHLARTTPNRARQSEVKNHANETPAMAPP